MAKSHLDRLDFSALSLIDNGIPNQLLRQHLNRIALDINDRKTDKNKRTVTIQIDLTPSLDKAGNLRHCLVTIDIKSKLPVHRTDPYQAAIDPTKGLVVNTEFPSQIDQRSLFEDDPLPEHLTADDDD